MKRKVLNAVIEISAGATAWETPIKTSILHRNSYQSLESYPKLLLKLLTNSASQESDESLKKITTRGLYQYLTSKENKLTMDEVQNLKSQMNYHYKITGGNSYCHIAGLKLPPADAKADDYKKYWVLNQGPDCFRRRVFIHPVKSLFAFNV